MSADRWDQCPACLRRLQKEEDARQQRVKDSYGQISAEEYLKLVAETSKPLQAEYRFREDYQVFMNGDGQLNISFAGSCNDCGFTVNFTHKRNYLSD